jgi:hypothetical protein
MGSPQDIQIIGMIRTDNRSAIDSAVAQAVAARLDPAEAAALAQRNEEAGFDRVPIGFRSSGPHDGTVAALTAMPPVSDACYPVPISATGLRAAASVAAVLIRPATLELAGNGGSGAALRPVGRAATSA